MVVEWTERRDEEVQVLGSDQGVASAGELTAVMADAAFLE